MKNWTPRGMAGTLLLIAVLVVITAPWLAPHPYATQYRDAIEASPTPNFWLGTDALGRDRLSRLVMGSRISLLLAPAAALLTTLIAGLLGVLAGLREGWVERVILFVSDLFLSLPWLFLLLTVRATLPLNVPAATSVLITFALLGCLGWAAPARLIRGGVRAFSRAEWLRQAQASGIPSRRLWWRHLGPHLLPLLGAQFLLNIPLFIMNEVNLGLLGLGVAEPLPSWGGLLYDLQNYRQVVRQPVLLVPLGVLFAVVCSLQILVREESSS